MALPVTAALLLAGCQRKPAVVTLVRADTAARNDYYISNRAPLVPSQFVKLPAGSIVPGGWIRKYLELQRDGLTGHLGEISAWLEKKDNAWFSGDGTGDHGWEEVPYWLKGYGDLGYELGDKKIIAETKRWLEKVFESQRPDGYFGPAVIPDKAKDSIPDLWPNMIMLWCMQTYYEYSRDPRVIPFMTAYFKWENTIPEDKLLTLYWENSRGGDNLYSIYWLYNRTGEKWLLDLAAKVHRHTADWMQNGNLPNWHNVNVAQCFREPATYYMQTGDSSALKATYADFHLIRNLYGQVPGGMFGADENARPGYSDPRQAVETCGMVEQMASDELLLGITGDPFWADHAEKVAFNTYPAAVMPDFRGLRYLTAPNMIVSDSKNHSPGIQNDGPFLMMNPFSSRCCQHNHAQGWPYYAEHLWMATPDNGLAAMLYNSCKVTARVGKGDSVTLEESTHYPFDEKVKITVHSAGANEFPVYLRIPGWCKGAKIYVNGKALEHSNTPASYTRISRTWQDKDEITLELPMQVSVRRWAENKQSASVNYGPLTFSLQIKEHYEQADSRTSAIGDSKWQKDADATKWPAFEIYPDSKWNYGLELDQADPAKAFTVVKKSWPADDFPFSQQHVPLLIKTKGREIPSWTIDQYGLCDTLPPSPVAVSTPEESLTLIPMGAARLRISAFPVVKGQSQ
ncbi:glycoside hydrolase family 127 protein [Compostibacter hankyongensis]|uniref:Glycoside hydrolase family 127 protein n=2 Tax=Compostibacter hankyongensis TaxID=1007089 RepID=A0ABP8FH30_9BACT